MRLWMITMAYVLASIGAGLVFPRVEHALFPKTPTGITVTSVQAFLSTVSSGMMALTGIVFSFAFVILQFSGAAYSPRLVSWFARDPLLFNALGVFIATFVFALTTLTWIERGAETYIPLYSTYIVFLLLVSSMIMLALLVQRIGELQISNVLRFVAAQGRKIVDRMPEERAAGSDAAAGAPDGSIAYTGEPKVVHAIRIERLAESAQSADVSVRLNCAVGDALTYGATLCSIYGRGSPVSEATVTSALVLGNERSPASDLKYAFRILVDIAIKGLSPGINDPTTALQSIDQLEDLLCRIADRDLTAGCIAKIDGVVRARAPLTTWEDYLSLAFDEIRLYGTGSLQILRRLLCALDDVEQSCKNGARADAVRRYRSHLEASVDHSRLDALDRASAHKRDRQGLGLSR